MFNSSSSGWTHLVAKSLTLRRKDVEVIGICIDVWDLRQWSQVNVSKAKCCYTWRFETVLEGPCLTSRCGNVVVVMAT